MTDEDKPEQVPEPQPQRSRNREDILREIKLALALDGLRLDERREVARGVNPYDNGLGSRSPDVWKKRRRS